MQIFVIESELSVADKYTVIIGNDYFFMSAYPNRANEVNMYGGRITTSRQLRTLTEEANILKHIPLTLKYAIKQWCQQIKREQR